MTTFNGRNGSISYNSLGLSRMRKWHLSIGMEFLDSSMDNTYKDENEAIVRSTAKTFKPWRSEWTVSGEGYATTDYCQKILAQMVGVHVNDLSSYPLSMKTIQGYNKISSNKWSNELFAVMQLDTTHFFKGRAFVKSIDFDSEAGKTATFDFELKGTGTLIQYG